MGGQGHFARGETLCDGQHALGDIVHMGQVELPRGSVDAQGFPAHGRADERRDDSRGMIVDRAVSGGKAHDGSSQPGITRLAAQVFGRQLAARVDVHRTKRRILGDRKAGLLAIDFATAGVDHEWSLGGCKSGLKQAPGCLDVDLAAACRIVLRGNDARHGGEVDNAVNVLEEPVEGRRVGDVHRRSTCHWSKVQSDDVYRLGFETANDGRADQSGRTGDDEIQILHLSSGPRSAGVLGPNELLPIYALL